MSSVLIIDDDQELCNCFNGRTQPSSWGALSYHLRELPNLTANGGDWDRGSLKRQPFDHRPHLGRNCSGFSAIFSGLARECHQSELPVLCHPLLRPPKGNSRVCRYDAKSSILLKLSF